MMHTRMSSYEIRRNLAKGGAMGAQEGDSRLPRYAMSETLMHKDRRPQQWPVCPLTEHQSK